MADGQTQVLTDISLAPLTTMQIGGAGRFFIRAASEADVIYAVKYAADHGLPLFVLGGGSNVLIADNGFNGLVVQIALGGVEIEDAGETSTVTAAAGEEWDDLVSTCVGRGLAGIECLSGIPGRVGGTPVQNVGAYGQEVSETIVEVRCYDRQAGEIVTLQGPDCGFAYRTSIFNSTQRERYIVLSVTFTLKKGGEPKISYKDLLERFEGRSPSLVETREAVLAIRRSKSMVIEPGDPNARSAGSFFKNPIVERGELARIRSVYEQVPYFEFGERVKIPAAWLIENAGFHKGYRLGNAGISTKHTLALVNTGGATAGEVVVLKEAIQRAVRDRFDITLQPEPVFVGF